MKIAVIGPVYPYRGGIAHSNTMLCSNLSKNHDLRVISFKRLYPRFLFPGKSQKYKAKKALDFNVTQLIDSVNPFSWFSVFRNVKRFSPDLVILQWWTIFLAPFSYMLLLLIRLFTNIKVGILCQNVLQHEERFFDKFVTKRVFCLADYFIALSSGDMKDLKNLVPKAKVKVLVEPTYDHFFGVKRIGKKEAQDKIDCKGNVLLFFGFVRPYKGLKYLLDALPLVLKEVDVKLLVVGEFWGDKGEYLDKIKRNNISDHVKIVDGYIPDDKVPVYMTAADVLVLPYVTATQSAILQTAFGFDKPVIATDVGSFSDLIKNNKTGFLVAPKDSRAFAKAIIDFYKHKKEKMFVENIRNERKTFEWDKGKEDILFHGA